MRALQVIERGSPPELREIAAPMPEPGEVQLRIEACGLNFADLLMITGEYQERPPLPFTLGLEVAGIVTALGDGVTSPTIGSRVAVFGGQGGLAEFGCFPAENCVVVPPVMPSTIAAAFQVAYGTSHMALQNARLQPGETLLVLGAAGGVGLTAVEIGKLMGARVIAVARGADKLAAAARAGADHLISSEDTDIRTAVRELGGADVVYDPVGGDQFSAALRATNRDGRVLVIGFASGRISEVPANIILVKNISVIGFYWGGYLAFKPDRIAASLRELMAWYENGNLRPQVNHIYALSDAAAALELLRSRKSTGKVVVEMT